jgi:subtilase family serine protease
MLRRSSLAAAAISFLILSACGAPPSQDASTSESLQLPASASPIAHDAVEAVHVCPGPAAPGEARCHSHVVIDRGHGPDRGGGAPRGFSPTDLRSAYVPPIGGTWPSSTGGIGQTIAVVIAYDYPYAESDLGVYRKTFGITPCTSASGCFRKVDQRGGASTPRSSCGWAQEGALDLQMASAICPNCHLLLVEADDNSFANLGAAVNAAAALGATAINNSYGGNESAGEASYASAYDHPGIAITVSSGDAGYGVQSPAAFGTVVAVGGTSLVRTASGWSETAWSGAGSGCSAYVSKPSWQLDPGCSQRTVADVSAVADPNTGVAVYDSFRCQGLAGWLVFGGTSVASPIVAGVYALAGAASLTSGPAASLLYASPSSLHDVTSGSNGSCGGSYLCSAGSGYDGPTGLGTPNGIKAF